MENSMEAPLKTRVALGLSSPTPGHIFRENNNSKRYVHPWIHSSTIYSSQNVETNVNVIDRGMDEEDVVLNTVGYFSAIKEWSNAICSCMDRPRDYHTKWNKSERER